ncbi:MAG: enoyl-CoA hydratase [Candidatus Azotimanducaceae bacterium]|jgi:enoyl-CoA hydratase
MRDTSQRGSFISAGNDLKAIAAGESTPTRHYRSETLEAIENLPHPVIAAVQGHCYNGSLELAIACDLLIAAESTRFTDTHGTFGMTPLWEINQRLPRRIVPIKQKK